MRKSGRLMQALFLLSALAVSPLLAEQPEADHTAREEAAGGKAPEQRLLTRQEALVKGLKEIGIQRFPLEKLAALFESRPRSTPQEFAQIVDLATDAMPGAVTDEQKEKLKKLYAEELGAVKQAPGTEFAAAAKLLAVALPKEPTLPQPSVPPSVQAQPQGALGELSGATVLPPVPTSTGPAGLNDILSKAATANAAALQQQMATQLAAAQGLLSKVQGDGQAQRRAAAGGGLLQSLAGLLNGQGKEGRSEGGSGGRGDFGRGASRPEHSSQPPPQQSSDEGSRKNDRLDEALKRLSERRRDRDRPQQLPQQQQQSPQQASNGDNKNDKRDNGSQAPSGPSRQEREKEALAAKKAAAKKDDDKGDLSSLLGKGDDKNALDAAKELLGGGGPQRRNYVGLGEAKALDPIANAGGDGFGGFGSLFGGDGANFSGPATGMGGQGPASVAGGGFEGDPFSGLGEDPGGYGGGGTGFSFAKPVEFGSSSSGGTDSASADDGDVTVDGGYTPDDTAAGAVGRAQKNRVPEVLVLPAGGEGRKGWVLDYVGGIKKSLCELPEAGAIGICQSLEARRQAREFRRKLSNLGLPVMMPKPVEK